MRTYFKPDTKIYLEEEKNDKLITLKAHNISRKSLQFPTNKKF
jgi:hypothetical protein